MIGVILLTIIVILLMSVNNSLWNIQKQNKDHHDIQADYFDRLLRK